MAKAQMKSYSFAAMKNKYMGKRGTPARDKYDKEVRLAGEVYQLTADQMAVINQAREQVKNGQFLTEEQANKEIDEWLKNSRK